MELTCGLEIHQRLSGRKLFCDCPSPKPDEPLPAQVLHLQRTLRSVSSELGVSDVAALFEGARERVFDYSAIAPFSCLVEEDEEPPHALNSDALYTSLQFSQAVNAQVVDELHVMRKTVVDGSNTSGFQRTALLASGGSLPSATGPIAIQTICLEEESAGILPAQNGRPAFRLDRLGIPLLEIATDPVFHSAADAAIGAKAIGDFLRQMPGVMRGLGTIRQDVNISIPGGARVEVKGAQELDLLPTLVEKEVARQKALLEIGAEVEKRKQNSKSPSSSMAWADVSPLFRSTSSKIISKALSNGGVVLAARLPLLAGLLGRELYGNRRFGTELSDYAKAAGGVGGLIHSDEDLVKYPISPAELEELSEALGLSSQDAFILIADAKPKAELGMKAALSRASRLDVPGETRKALPDGGSQFMRPLAGAHRMYPETDIPPIRITPALLASANRPIETFDARRIRLGKMLGHELGEQVLHSHHYELFDYLVSHAFVDPRLAASVIEQTFTTLRREGVLVERIEKEKLLEIFQLYHKDQITKAVIQELVKKMASEPSLSALSILQREKWARVRGKELASLWHAEGGDLKSFMAKYRLVVDGADVAALAKK